MNTLNRKPESHPLAATVDALFVEWDKPDSPGVAVAVVQDGHVIFAKGYGMANLEHHVPITAVTVFDTCSISKQFMGMAIAILVKEGRLSLDDDIRTYVASVPDFGKPITIRHLVHHTSGLRDRVGTLALAGCRLEDVIASEDILKMVQAQAELNFDPGTEMLYSNTGYNLLARTVEVVTGESFARWTEENIFAPLGMSNTHFHDDHQKIVKNRADSYVVDASGVFKNAGNQLTALGSSSLYSTATDMAQWMINLDVGNVGGADVLLLMRQSGVLNNGEETGYAFGLGLGTYRGLPMEKHDGSWAGFRTSVAHFPAQKFGVVVLSNLASFKPSTVTMQLTDLYLAADFTEASPHDKRGESSKVGSAEIEPALFDGYSGMYQLEGPFGLILSFWRDGDRYFRGAIGQEAAEIFPSSDPTFFLKTEEIGFTFHRQQDGAVARLTVHENGDRVAHRVLPWTPTAEELHACVGTYESLELRTVYTLRVEDGNLIAKHQRHEDIQLRPLTKDRFGSATWFFASTDLERDGSGQVTGLRVSSPRSRNIHFMRKE